ncbi:MAG: fibronectin type III domain-containing protein, partial [Gammaproteobacteria bacterium]|nr:fibronectin type III domain-containing protein [Gammaproteobacteria bacterium]
VATADLAVAGSVSGNYQNTWANDNSTQTITERQGGNKKRGRYGYLEHKWTFQVVPGNAVVFSADASTTTGNDSFTFAYSTNNSQYVNMFTLDNGNSGGHQFMLPSSVSGTVYIRVRDNVRSTTAGATSYSVRVDQLAIRSENGEALPLPTPPQSLAASTAGADSIDVTWTDTSDYELGFDVERRLDGSNQWQQAGTAQANARSYRDTRLQAGALYYYRVSAFNSTGSSAATAPVSARTAEQPAAQLSLQASGYKVRGKHNVRLSWSGANSSVVEIYRDGRKVGSVSNSGSYNDNIGSKGGASYSYELCEANSSTCSNKANVVF